MKDRFDLEYEISSLYLFVDQLEAVKEGILEDELTKDESANALEGLKVLLNLHIRKLTDTMSQCFYVDKYRDSEHHDFPC